jgi:hypothetical protein
LTLTPFDLLDFETSSHPQELEPRTHPDSPIPTRVHGRLHWRSKALHVQANPLPLRQLETTTRRFGSFGLLVRFVLPVSWALAQLPKNIGAPGVERRELDSELTAVSSLRAPGHSAFDQDLILAVLEPADEFLIQLGQVARAHLHPSPADVGGVGLKRTSLALGRADIDEGNERNTSNVRISAVFD